MLLLLFSDDPLKLQICIFLLLCYIIFIIRQVAVVVVFLLDRNFYYMFALHAFFLNFINSKQKCNFFFSFAPQLFSQIGKKQQL